MKIGSRPLSTIFGAPFRRHHYVAARNMLSVYDHPAEMFSRYLLRRGSYPAQVGVRTPAGRLELTAYSHDDVLTINEIFCRHDYPSVRGDRLLVDFGSNIGISAAFFLSHNPDSFAYLFEPLPQNIDRLKKNLLFAEGRYALREVAVGSNTGKVRFGWEASGRYGGVGRETGQYIEVDCQDSNVVLREIIDSHGHIDVLKIDIETLEKEVVERLTPDLSSHIAKVYAEFPFETNPLEPTHTLRQYGSIAQFRRRC